MERSWGALEVELPRGLEGAVLAVLGAVCLGAEFRSTGSGKGELLAYFPTRADASEAAVGVAALLRKKGIQVEASDMRVTCLEDGLWVERYQAGLQPFFLGQRFLVDPTGHGSTPAGRIRVSLVPGRAFGTGEHPTTRLCVEALERHVEAGSRWADLGCGSGILSVVALHCGARELLAVDLDPEAVRIAREVVQQNRCGGAVRVMQGTHDDVEPRAWDGVVCNIAASYFLGSAGSVIDRLRPGGLLIASGFLTVECDEIRASLARAGMIEVEDRTCEEWCALVLRQPEEPVREGS
jgi:ribosomal protein L11 methyltransferase